METAKEAIIFAAMKGVRLYGLQGVRIRHISAIAGILPSSIYGYFTGKEDLMQACFSYTSDRLAELITQYKSLVEEVESQDRPAWFWNRVFHWFVTHPDENMFFYRYCDRPDLTREVLCSSSSYLAYCSVLGNLFQDNVPEDTLLSWLHMILDTARYAGYVTRGILSETECSRAQIYNCIFKN